MARWPRSSPHELWKKRWRRDGGSGPGDDRPSPIDRRGRKSASTIAPSGLTRRLVTHNRQGSHTHPIATSVFHSWVWVLRSRVLHRPARQTLRGKMKLLFSLLEEDVSTVRCGVHRRLAKTAFKAASLPEHADKSDTRSCFSRRSAIPRGSSRTARSPSQLVRRPRGEPRSRPRTHPGVGDPGSSNRPPPRPGRGSRGLRWRAALPPIA